MIMPVKSLSHVLPHITSHISMKLKSFPISIIINNDSENPRVFLIPQLCINFVCEKLVVKFLFINSVITNNISETPQLNGYFNSIITDNVSDNRLQGF